MTWHSPTPDVNNSYRILFLSFELNDGLYGQRNKAEGLGKRVILGLDKIRYCNFIPAIHYNPSVLVSKNTSQAIFV